MPRNYHEDKFQIQVASYLHKQYPQLLWFHCPNGGSRDKREAAKLKAMGVRPGVADIILFWLGGKGAIELKCGKNKQQDTQKFFQSQWVHSGGQYAVCYSLDEVIAVLDSWKVPKIIKGPTLYANGAHIDKHTARGKQ